MPSARGSTGHESSGVSRASGVSRGSSAATTGSVLFIPAGAHVSGAHGTNWKTDIEVANPGTAQGSFTIALLKANQANPSPSTKSYVLSPGRSVRYNDALASLFGFSGSAALRITVSSGMIAITSRTYNDTPSGTYGQFIDGVLEGTAIHAGQEGRIIQLSHSRSKSLGYRTNIGFVNATTSGLGLLVELYLSNGTLLGTHSYTLGPYEFRQIDKIFETVTNSDVAAGYAVLSSSTAGGSFFAYASVIDNRTGDPIYITPGVRQRGAAPPVSSPTPTPPLNLTPTPTPSVQRPNLTPYQPTGWTAPLVVSGTTGTSVSGGLAGGQPSYFDWALANYGPGDAFFPAGSRLVEIDLDGSGLVGFVAPDGGYTVQEGHYAYYQDYEVDSIPAGQHSGELIGDPGFVVAESDEGDNSYTTTWTWNSGSTVSRWMARTAHVFGAGVSSRPIPGWEESRGRLRRVPVARRGPAREPQPSGLSSAMMLRSAASLGILYIPAAAHVSGAQGTNWRTDLEIHNPGSVQGRYEIALLKRNQDNSSPQIRTVTVGAGRSLRLEDVLASEFGFSGAAALRITRIAGEAIVTSRTYNLTTDGTYGQFIPGVPLSTALTGGENALQIQLSHQPGVGSGFRTNIGLLNCTGRAIVVEARFYSSSGSSYGTKTYNLKAYEFIQVDRIFESVTGSAVTDGYVTLSSPTDGARFFGYASIIDNRTGDPVFAPAIPVLLAEPQPVEPDVAMDAVMLALGQVGQGNLPSVVEVVTEVQQHGMESYLDGIVSQAPDVISRIPNGLRVDLGSHLVMDNGSIVSGSLRWTYSNLQNGAGSIASGTSGQAGGSGGHLAFDNRADLENLMWNGQYSKIETFTGHVDLELDSGEVSGDVSINGAGASSLSPGSPGSVSVSGSAHVDTSICPNYPISGSVTITDDGKDYTITFSDACDGSYDYEGNGEDEAPHSGELAIRLTWSGPQNQDLVVVSPLGEWIYPGHGGAPSGGLLDLHSNQGCVMSRPDPMENVFWPEGKAPRGTYSFWVQLTDPCGGPPTPVAHTFSVLVHGVVVQTYEATPENDLGKYFYTY